MEPNLYIDIPNENSKSKEPILARYDRRHHAPNQIIGDKSNGTMTRRKLKDTCLLADFEQRNVKNDLDNESLVETMNENRLRRTKPRLLSLDQRIKM